MKDNPIIHHTSYTIRACEVNSEKKITFPALVQLFQEASLENVIKLKLSAWDDVTGNFGWVLLRKEVTVKSYPKLGQKVIIKTCPSGFERIFAYRDYKMFDDQEKLLAYAASTWTYMNLDTRKLASIPARLDFFDASRTMEVLPRPKSKIPILTTYSNVIQYKIRRYHMDWNGHVNNNHYFKFVLESLKLPAQHSQPSEVILHIKNECLLGETITVKANTQSNPSLVTITKNKDDVVAHATVLW